MLFLHHLVVLGVQIGQFGLKLRTLGGVLFVGDLVFKLDDLGIHAQNFDAQGFQFAHGHFALVQRGGQVRADLFLLLVQHGQLTFQKVHNRIRLRDQLLQLVVDRGRAHTFLTHTFGFHFRENTHKAFPARLRPHLVEIG